MNIVSHVYETHVGRPVPSTERRMNEDGSMTLTERSEVTLVLQALLGRISFLEEKVRTGTNPGYFADRLADARTLYRNITGDDLQ